MTFYKRHLPHWQPDEAEFFVTFRLAGSLPAVAIKRLKKYNEELHKGEEKKFKSNYSSKIFQKYENLIDGAEKGPTWLKEKKITQIVQESLHFYDNKEYELYAYCIMPNHVHVVFKLIGRDKPTHVYPVTNVIGKIKSYSAQESNKILNRKGAFWQAESYDRVIRDEKELENTIAYTLNNPVKAGLAKRWKDWPYTYCKPEFLISFA
jgi:REP element-mobilizing transposase RayT